MALGKDIDHSKALYTMDEYVTAWFCYWLKGDTNAFDAFFTEDKGLHPSICFLSLISVNPLVQFLLYNLDSI